MNKNSVIDAKVELEEQVALEMERCKDIDYFYRTYWKVIGKGRQLSSAEAIIRTSGYRSNERHLLTTREAGV